jgi:hypothetical protein
MRSLSVPISISFLLLFSACVDLTPPLVLQSPRSGGMPGSNLDGPISSDAVPGRGGIGGNGQNGSGGVVFDAPRGAAETRLGTDGTIDTEVVDTPMLSGDSQNLDVFSNAGGAIHIPETGGAIANGGSPASGGIIGSGGAIANGGSPASGGIIGSGGAMTNGGSPASGGIESGGMIGTGGDSTTGGASGTGGVPVECGTVKTNYYERILFRPNEGSGALLTSPTPLPSGAQLTNVKSGPSPNPNLCLPGCDALKMSYTTGTVPNTFVGMVRFFDTPVNLTDSKISFSLTIDNPSNVPIEVKVYTTGDASTNWAWGTATTLSGETLAPFTAGDTFQDATLFPANGSVYCTSATKIVGLLLQNTQAITSENDGTVTVYFNALTIRPAS